MRKIYLSLFFVCISFADLLADGNGNNTELVNIGNVRISSADFVSVSVSNGKVTFTFHEDVGTVFCEVVNIQTNEKYYGNFVTSFGEGIICVPSSVTGYKITITAEDGSSINGTI